MGSPTQERNEEGSSALRTKLPTPRQSHHLEPTISRASMISGERLLPTPRSARSDDTGTTGKQPLFSELYELKRKIVGIEGKSDSFVYEAQILEQRSRYGRYGARVGVKVVYLGKGVRNTVNSVRWELKGLERAGGHPNVLKGYEAIIEKKSPKPCAYLVSELCDADMFMATEKKLNYECCMSLFKQMAASVRYIHSKRMCHRDIKLENFFLSYPMDFTLEEISDPNKVHNFTVKLGDFGFWTKSHDSNGDILLHYSHCGSDVYSAPEQALKTIANKVGYDGQKADIFSLGVCLFVLHNGYPPWNTNRKLSDPYNKLWVRGRVADYWRTIDYYTPEHLRPSMAFRDLVSRMMSVDPDQRPTLDEVMSHPFVTGENDDHIEFHPTNSATPISMVDDIVEGLAAKAKATKKKEEDLASAEGTNS